MKTKFTDYLMPLTEADTFAEDKAELIDFIDTLDKDTFYELMDVLSSIMMDPTQVGHEDNHEEELEYDNEIKDAMDAGSDLEDISDDMTESLLESFKELLERGTVPAGERLAAAREKKKDPRIKKMMRIKNAWIKKCKKRKLRAQKQESGKWGCGKVDKALAILQKKWQHNRQHSVKVD